MQRASETTRRVPLEQECFEWRIFIMNLTGGETRCSGTIFEVAGFLVEHFLQTIELKVLVFLGCTSVLHS